MLKNDGSSSRLGFAWYGSAHDATADSATIAGNEPVLVAGMHAPDAAPRPGFITILA
jgi:hypothetical protein